MFDWLIKWLKRHLKIRAASLKHAPGILPGKEQIAADHANALVGAAVDVAATSGVPIIENSLRVRPEQLKNAPGLVDGQHELAAAAINAIVADKLGVVHGDGGGV